MIDAYKFNHEIIMDFDLSHKHLFKKKAGKASSYYQLVFDETLDNDLSVLSEMYNRDDSFKIFGLHTNLYITDHGFKGLFIDISSVNPIITFEETSETFKVTSNVSVSAFIKFAMEKGYDFSALAGVPGFVGSGVAGNSGWVPSGKAFSDYVQAIIVYDFKEASYKKWIPDSAFLKERDSYIKQKNKTKVRYFIKEVILKASQEDINVIKQKYNTQINKRKESLKYGFAEGTAGSIWSNAHLKKQIGTSFPKMLRATPELNANFNGATYGSAGSHFFTTSESTTDKDVAKLFRHTITKAKEIYHVDLHKEVIILDYDGEIDLHTFLERNTE